MNYSGQADTTRFTSDIIAGGRATLANAVKASGVATGAAPIVEAVGDDTNIGLLLKPKGTGKVMNNARGVDLYTVTTDATAGAVTYTAAQILGGLILRDPNGLARTDVLPTAALLVAAVPGAVVGSGFYFVIRNTADAAETLTINGGSGGTASGTQTIAQSNSKLFFVRLDNVTAAAEAYTFYSIGTFVH